MHAQIDTHTNTVTLTCTFGDLAKLKDLDMGIYATPTPQGLANQVYMSQRAKFRYDFLLASLEDFEAALGYEIDTEDMDEADWEAQEGLEVTITMGHVFVANAKYSAPEGS